LTKICSLRNVAFTSFIHPISINQDTRLCHRGLHVLKLIPQLTVVDLLYAQQQLRASHETMDVGFVILLLLLLHQKEKAE
jgi:hypothetical protein